MKQPSPDARSLRGAHWPTSSLSRASRRGMWVGIMALQLLLAGRGFALDPNKSLVQFNCQNWTRQNGLPADKVNSVAQTQDGYLWLATQNGLVRFDGLEFKVIPVTLPEARGHDVRALARSGDGSLWFAINAGGFGRYDGQAFSAAGDQLLFRPNMSVEAIMEARDGALWLGENEAVNRWVKGDPGASTFAETMSGPVISLCEGAAGTIWLGTAERGLFSWANGKIVPFHDGVLKQRNIFSLAVDTENQLWVGTGNGLYCYASNGEAKAVAPVNYEIKALLVDRHGILWVGTSGLGLGRYQNGQFTFLKKVDGLGSDNVTSLFEDAEGSLWVGTRDGLSQLTDLKFPVCSDAEGIGAGSSHAVVAARNGGVWVGTATGASHFEGQPGTNHNAETLLPSAYIKQIFQARNGELYAEDGDKNINVFAGDQLLAQLTNSTWADGFAEDDESVLVGSGNTLFRIQDGQLKPYAFRNGLAPDYYWINSLCVAKDGVIWVACNNGIFRVQHGIYQHWAAADGLSGDPVLWICEDGDGSIWAGLPTGMARLKDGQVKNIKPENGLPDNRIFAIVPDDCGFFWCDSGRGIFRVSRANLNAFADGTAARVDCELFDSLEAVKFTDRTDQGNSGCKSADGRVWFPSPWGVVMIDPAHIPTNGIAPPVHVSEILANGREFGRSGPILVPPGKGELECHFSALSFIAPQKIRLRYQLQGYDQDWVDGNGRRVAFYTNLKPGRYTFRVVAANADGVWNAAGDSVQIELRPHFYQTVWFYLLGAGAAGALLAGIYAWRVRHLRRRQRVLQQARDQLETEVRHRTAELATANISLKTEVVERQRTAGELAQRTKALEAEIEERKQMELELEVIHKRLLETSRQAGMAEVATNVLHNVGNVLNSVNVSATLVLDQTKESKVSYLAKVAALLNEHAGALDEFLNTDAKGRQLPAYVSQLAQQLAREQQQAIQELELLRQNIEHIKDIVAMQQSYAKISGVTETVPVVDLIEDALGMNSGSLSRHEIELVREFRDVPPVTVEKHKVLQILVNLIRNAKHACDDSGRPDKLIKLRLTPADRGVLIAVIDNGIGIPPENLTRIFNHGFTTRKGGHGFGLHSGALAAKELGGSLTVHSDGTGQGATFTLMLPLQPPQAES